MTLRVHVDSDFLADLSQSIGTLLEDHVPSRVASADSSLWGPAAQAEASIRLGWVADPALMRPLVDDVDELRRAFAAEGVTRFVLCGMGGSSLAPEVMASWSGVELEIVDSTHPDHVAQALAGDLRHTAVVVSSKSGTTVETATTRAAFAEAFTQAGIDPSTRILIVTDPGSPLHKEAEASGHRVFLADAHVGGRFSALSAFGLVPATLAGVDTAALISDAHDAWSTLHQDTPDNPAVTLAAALSTPQRDIVVLTPSDAIPGLGDWIEQLVAESTGKDGLGVLPVAVHSATPPEASDTEDDVLIVDLSGTRATQSPLSVEGTLGGSFLLWEYATAFAGVLLGVNPFDQPDVESAKTAARSLLESTPKRQDPSETSEGYTLWAPGDQTTLVQAWSDLRSQVGPSGYLALQVYGNRLELAHFGTLRDALAAEIGRPVTLGFGPRFLHSTGQFHKGGTPDGVFFQLEIEPRADLDIPGYPYSFHTLIDAQSWGDRQVLTERGRPVLTLRVPSVDAAHTLLSTLWSSA
jgi:glucose-6-phosphate isomerase